MRDEAQNPDEKLKALGGVIAYDFNPRVCWACRHLAFEMQKWGYVCTLLHLDILHPHASRCERIRTDGEKSTPTQLSIF